MTERDHIMGLGLTLVDAKTWVKDCLPLPDGEQLINLLDTQTNFVYSAGGVISNVLTAYSRFTGNSVFLLGCIGNDKRGQDYQKLLDSRLNKLQVHQTEPTGVVAHVLNQDGSLVDKKSFYGAARKVKTPNETLHNYAPTCFITNAAVFSMPEVLAETDKVFEYLRRSKNGQFIFSCGGTRPDRTSREFLLYSLHERQMVPDIVVGNEVEMCYLAGTLSFKEAVNILFPQSRIVILTRAEKGSIIRFEGKTLFIPAYPVNSKEKLDSIGMGDCYLGVWLGALSNIPSSKWKAEDIYKAACTASYSASSVMTQTTTQLSEINAERARWFYNQFKS